ncbi:DUF2306 domain-containing protein [Marivita hallyeonensis]|uniref:Predicted membrane protein n=1 Tax=Marivita hallyeonensis TaxID=996342 RepID=A0A1M5VHJ8_9RHOB|nr:DUF2306 domain-containing protein [Marivita hallyeonensis]SHH74393.1 Predicted membrane protein [Marivita hallyeonensis]
MRPIVPTIALLILAINTLWFVAYSAQLGVQGLLSDAPTDLSLVFTENATVANASLAAHMVAGAVLTIGAPLQALPIVRRRWPRMHRRGGYTLFVAAVVTGIGGLGYIALTGTIGGRWMDVWFAIYGVLIMLAAANTVYFAIEKDRQRHFRWAVRLIILAVGSWIYRMHYVIWYALTDGAASNDAFTGLFDQIQVFAFFLPYLLIAEIGLRLFHVEQRSRPVSKSSSQPPKS